MNTGLIKKYFFLDPEALQKFVQLGDEFQEWNAKVNLISRKDEEHLEERHVLHSLAILKYLRERDLHPARIMDLGTGGGFPGLPLAIAMPDTRFTLVDSIGKKIHAVQEMTGKLSLHNVECVVSRAENLKGKFDLVVSRAVAPMPALIGYCSGIKAKKLIALKGGDLSAELRGIPSDKLEVIELNTYFEEEFFTEKKIVICDL